MPPNYQNSQIYKLVSNKTTDIYIGSCLMRLSTRLSCHKQKDNKCVSKKLFVNDAIITIVLIENFPCHTKNELKARELHHITTNKCININKPFVCDIPFGDGKEWNKEYYTINSEHIKENKKEYRKANKEKISACKKAYRQSNLDHIKKQAKEYYESHKDQVKEYEASRRDQINTRRRALRAEKKLALNLENTLNKNIVV